MARARQRRRSGPAPSALRPALVAVLAALHADAALAAAFVPGQAPMAVDTQSGGAERPSDTYRLVPAPVRTWGVVALDVRHRDFASGQRSNGEVFSGTVNGATYLWQPWFVQVVGSLGLVAGVDRNTETGSTTNTSGIGSLNVAVFPVSRFPFNFFAEVNDSRASGQITDVDYRSYRARVSQSYTPALGNERYYGSYEYSLLETIDSGLDVAPGTAPTEDVVQLLRLGASRSWQTQSLEGDVSVSRNQRQEGALTQETKLDFANIYHLFRPQPNFTLNSGLSYTRTTVEAEQPLTIGITLPSTRTSSDFTQLLSFMTWRPAPGTWLAPAGRDVLVSGTFRAFEFGNASDGSETQTRGATAQLGLTYPLTPRTQLFSTTQAGYFTGDIEASSVAAQSVGVNYNADPIPLGRFVYTWNSGVTGTVGMVSGGPNDGSDYLAQANFSHSLSRPLEIGVPGSLVGSISQGLAYAHGSESDNQATVTTTLATFWNSPATNGTQAFAGLTFADARRYGDFPGYFQLVNLQANLNVRLARWSSLSAGLTFQANRSEEERDVSRPFDPFLDAVEGEWRTSYGAQATYSHARFLGVPRLLYTALLQTSSYDFDSRAAGNANAPLFRADWLFENRLEYRIGKLTLLGTVRWADVQNRGTNFSVFVRAQRSFGAL